MLFSQMILSQMDLLTTESSTNFVFFVFGALILGRRQVPLMEEIGEICAIHQDYK